MPIFKHLGLLTALLLCGGAWAGELVVIVSARSPLAALRAEQVADIFLGQAASFPDGSEATAVDQAPGSAQRDEFYLKIANRSPALMKAYWTKRIFTGRGHPPRELPGNAAVRKLVADNPGMIGYIERSALDASVKPVLVVH
ncbi:type 2 periplasmic-binding domain-containing protein [Massilia endophytica]|uniref:phosphate ABC transporter substrate-binding protein n=1 Tax=Massilia endophytica TaxID=2899220 RepID=UPI001E41AFDC|nr:phosphate ABC transporter substrate-binding protein [Massilia endophytica]UGQ48195.1 phosphate ABC transporter substrate-binding protein [Massilia endophytica]